MFFQGQISCFTSICDLFTYSPSYNAPEFAGFMLAVHPATRCGSCHEISSVCTFVRWNNDVQSAARLELFSCSYLHDWLNEYCVSPGTQLFLCYYLYLHEVDSMNTVYLQAHNSSCVVTVVNVLLDCCCCLTGLHSLSQCHHTAVVLLLVYCCHCWM
jgi:hypothetical protein